MYRKNIFVIFILVSSILVQFPVSLASEGQVKFSSDDSHLIEDVPYFSQIENHYCEIACYEMVLEYYGINITQSELLYFTGGGYSFAYKPTLKSTIEKPRLPICYQPQIWTDELTAEIDDVKLFTELFGFDYKFICPEKIVNHDKEWETYWEILKEYISNDVPVITAPDPLAWPPFLECMNFTFVLPKMFGCTHLVVVVGFNEENNTICVNDPVTGYFGYPEKGTYRWLSIDEYRRAISRVKWPIKDFRYQLQIFENSTKHTFPKEYIHNFIHSRNIKRTIGLKSAYDSNHIDDFFNYYGISALEEFRDDIKYKAAERIILHKILMKTNILYNFKDALRMFEIKTEYESLNKKHISNLLYENKELNPYYEKESLLFLSESKCWEKINNLSKNLSEVVNNNGMFKAMILSKPLFSEIVNQLDSIIAVRRLIVDETL